MSARWATTRPACPARRPTAPRRLRSRITGGGTANAVERDSEQGATYEVEVTKPNGKTVDVYLDASYNLVSVDGDSEENESGDAGEQER